MPAENLEEQGLEKNPNLELASLKFKLTTKKYQNDKVMVKKLLGFIKEENMAPFYKLVCLDLDWTLDKKLLAIMEKENKDRLQELESKQEDAEKNAGETEVRDIMLKKAEYLCRIGNKEDALAQFIKTSEKCTTVGYRLDLVFHQLRIGLFYMDHDLIKRCLEKATSLLEEGGDWDRRNRLKVYRATYCMSIRDFQTAAQLFLDTIATFTSYEVMNYRSFITYTVYCCLIALERPQLREKVIRGSEILEVLHGLPLIRKFLFSFYECQYQEFFISLGEVEQKMKYDRWLQAHYKFYTREMRIRAYSQLLESYRSLSLDYMANAFGVTPPLIDQELARFIAQGRLHCKIDKVNGIVETNRPDSKNRQYQATIKHGDLLLNRIQKLSRVINV